MSSSSRDTAPGGDPTRIFPVVGNIPVPRACAIKSATMASRVRAVYEDDVDDAVAKGCRTTAKGALHSASAPWPGALPITVGLPSHGCLTSRFRRGPTRRAASTAATRPYYSPLLCGTLLSSMCGSRRSVSSQLRRLRSALLRRLGRPASSGFRGPPASPLSSQIRGSCSAPAPAVSGSAGSYAARGSDTVRRRPPPVPPPRYPSPKLSSGPSWMRGKNSTGALNSNPRSVAAASSVATGAVSGS